MRIAALLALALFLAPRAEANPAMWAAAAMMMQDNQRRLQQSVYLQNQLNPSPFSVNAVQLAPVRAQFLQAPPAPQRVPAFERTPVLRQAVPIRASK